MNIADQLETHAQQELQHALIISRQIDYLGKMPTVNPKPVKVSEDLKEMFRFDPDNENETIRNYRKRIRQCEAIGEFALAEQIRKILESGLSVRTDNILAEMGDGQRQKFNRPRGIWKIEAKSRGPPFDNPQTLLARQ